jgi:hypothetical protein
MEIRVDGPNSGDGIDFDASNQMLQEFVELKTWSGAPVISGLLGKGAV